MPLDKPHENWTRFPNNILDNLESFSPPEVKLLCWIVRQNLGWGDQGNTRFSISYLQKNTGLSNRCVIDSIASLIEKGALERLESPGQTSHFSVVWGQVPMNEVHRTYERGSQVPMNEVHTIKETIQINKNKETSSEFCLDEPQQDRNADSRKIESEYRNLYKTLTGREARWKKKDNDSRRRLQSEFEVDRILENLRLLNMKSKLSNGDFGWVFSMQNLEKKWEAIEGLQSSVRSIGKARYKEHEL